MQLLSAGPDLHRDLPISYSENYLPIHRVAAMNHSPTNGPRRWRQAQPPLGARYGPRRRATSGDLVAKLAMRPDKSPGRHKCGRWQNNMRSKKLLALRKCIVGRRHENERRQNQDDADRKFAQVYHLGKLTGAT